MYIYFITSMNNILQNKVRSAFFTDNVIHINFSERGECHPPRMDDAFLLRFLRARLFIPARAHRLVRYVALVTMTQLVNLELNY